MLSVPAITIAPPKSRFQALTFRPRMSKWPFVRSGMDRPASLAWAAVPNRSSAAIDHIIGFRNFIVVPIVIEGPVRLAGIKTRLGDHSVRRQSTGRNLASTILLTGKARNV